MLTRPMYLLDRYTPLILYTTDTTPTLFCELFSQIKCVPQVSMYVFVLVFNKVVALS